MKNLLDYLILIADKTLASDIDKAVKKDINTLKKLVDDTARDI